MRSTFDTTNQRNIHPVIAASCITAKDYPIAALKFCFKTLMKFVDDDDDDDDDD